MYFFQSSPVSYKRFIKRFPTENSLIKLYAKTCVDFDIESKPKKRRCPHCGSCQNGPFRKNNEKLRLCKRCGRTFSIFRNSIFDKSKADFRIWMYIGYCMFYYQNFSNTNNPRNSCTLKRYDLSYIRCPVQIIQEPKQGRYATNIQHTPAIYEDFPQHEPI